MQIFISFPDSRWGDNPVSLAQEGQSHDEVGQAKAEQKMVLERKLKLQMLFQLCRTKETTENIEMVSFKIVFAFQISFPSCLPKGFLESCDRIRGIPVVLGTPSKYSIILDLH